MIRRICIVRVGHIGDVILTEPIAAAFVREGWIVDLCTDCLQIGHLLSSYHQVIAFNNYLDGRLLDYERIHLIRYELHREMHYIDAYAADVGIKLGRRIPHLRISFPAIADAPYGLICPDTSSWMKSMRCWPIEKFHGLFAALGERTGIPWVILRPENSFIEMLQLIQHAEVVVSNDSAPCHIAQAMRKNSVVIFGCTSPEHVLVSPLCDGVIGTFGCQGCRHIAKDRSVECSSPLCIETVEISAVVNAVLRRISPAYSRAKLEI